MADYAKFITRFLYSLNSDYSDPVADTKSQTTTLTPDEYELRRVEVDDTGNTFTLDAHFATITGLAVWNLDTAQAVTAAFTSGAAADSININAGGCMILANVDITEGDDLVLTSASGSIDCLVAICGT